MMLPQARCDGGGCSPEESVDATEELQELLASSSKITLLLLDP